MRASRGCMADLACGLYDWDPEFKRCPQTLLNGFVGQAYVWWRMWRMTKEGPIAAALVDNPNFVRQAIIEFEHARLVAEQTAMTQLETRDG